MKRRLFLKLSLGAPAAFVLAKYGFPWGDKAEPTLIPREWLTMDVGVYLTVRTESPYLTTVERQVYLGDTKFRDNGIKYQLYNDKELTWVNTLGSEAFVTEAVFLDNMGNEVARTPFDQAINLNSGGVVAYEPKAIRITS